MTGYPGYNYAAFHECATVLREAGYVVLNPAEHFDGRQDLEWTTYLREGIRQVTISDFVVVLNDWEFSRGANVEVNVAKALKLPILHCGTLEPVWLPL